MKTKTMVPTVCGLVLMALTPLVAQAALTWSLLHDQTVISTSSEELTRSLRALALADDNMTIYAGYIQKNDGASVVRYTLAGGPPVGTATGLFDVTTVAPSGNLHQPKAVAVDSRGIVFAGSSKDGTSGDNARIMVLDATLTSSLRIPLADIDFPGTTGETVEGLAIKTFAGTQYLYASRHHTGSAYIERYIIGGAGVVDATLTLDPTFGTGGRYSLITDGGIVGANLLYGMEVADDGTIFVTSREDNAVYRISADLSTVTTATVNRAIDIALYDSRAFVTSYNGANSSIVELLQSDLSVLSQFDAFAYFPRIGADGNVADTGYSGIEIDSIGRIYLGDQLYLRNSVEAHDRILVSSPIPFFVPEPASLSLVLIAGAAVLRRRPSRS